MPLWEGKERENEISPLYDFRVSLITFHFSKIIFQRKGLFAVTLDIKYPSWAHMSEELGPSKWHWWELTEPLGNGPSWRKWVTWWQALNVVGTPCFQHFLYFFTYEGVSRQPHTEMCLLHLDKLCTVKVWANINRPFLPWGSSSATGPSVKKSN